MCGGAAVQCLFFIQLRKEKDHDYDFVFLSFFDIFSGLFFSVLLEELLYLVSSSCKLRKNINALKSTNIICPIGTLI